MRRQKDVDRAYVTGAIAASLLVAFAANHGGQWYSFAGVVVGCLIYIWTAD